VNARLLDSCRETLQGWTAPTADQDRLRRRYLDHLHDHPDGWSRSCQGAHLTASSLICAADGQVLLTLHRRIGRWLQTGGHLEATDGSIEGAALREASEESGLDDLDLDLDPLLLSEHQVPCGVVRPTFHLDVQFLIRSEQTAVPVIGIESLAVRWFPHDQLPAVDDSVSALVAEAGTRLGW
jgi:8-oxo-dGTP pyrophosphatase MutT (NUDIX family)